MENFYKISIDLFEDFECAPVDLYLCISEKRFIKIVRSGDGIPHDTFLRYKDRGHRNLYIDREILRLCQKIKIQEDSIKEELQDKSIISIPNRQKYEMAAYNNLKQQLDQTSILSEKVASITEMAIESIAYTMQTKAGLKHLLNRYFDKDDMVAGHVLLNIYLAAKLLENKNGDFTANQVETLALASFFHDIMLFSIETVFIDSHSALGKIHSLKAKTELIGKHPLNGSSKLLEFFPDSKDAAIVVAQHHFRPDGDGFCQPDETELTELSIVFIIAEYICTRLYENDLDTKKLKNIIISAQEFFSPVRVFSPYLVNLDQITK